MEITSKNNLTIKDLKKQKDHNRFLLFLDTPKMVEEALIQGFEPLHIFVLKGKTFDFLNKNQTTFVSKEVLNSLSTVKTNAGIVGVFKMKFSSVDHIQGNFVVLDNVQDSGNVGAIMRSALACNFLDVVLVDCASATSEKVVRSSAGAVLKLNIVEMTCQQYQNTFCPKNLYYADMGGKDIFDFKPDLPVGIVMGNEGHGVSETSKQKCMGSIAIPMKNNLESLNVAVSAGIIMYQICFGGKK